MKMFPRALMTVVGIAAVLVSVSLFSACSIAPDMSGNPNWEGLKWADDGPAWMPGGHAIVFASNRRGNANQRSTNGGPYAIYSVRTDGQGLRGLTTPGSCHDDYPAPSPDGREIAFLRGCGSWETGALLIIPTKSGTPRTLATHVDLTTPPAWSADGRLLAFRANDGKLWALDLRSGRRHVVARSVGAFAWAHRGEAIAYGCHGGSICIAAARGGPVRRVGPSKPDNGINAIAWSADDSRLAFTEAIWGTDSWYYNAWVIRTDGTGGRVVEQSTSGDVQELAWIPGSSELIVDGNHDYSFARGANGAEHDLPFQADIALPSTNGKTVIFVHRVFWDTMFGENGDRSSISIGTIATGQALQLTQS